MKFKIKVHQVRWVETVVEGVNYFEAASNAECAARLNANVPFFYSVSDAVQLGEPWIRSHGWYDLHEPGPIIVVERAMGNVFTEEDITQLKARIAKMGFTLQSSWNGNKCNSVSFQVSGRKGTRPMSKRLLAILLAPRHEL